MSNLLIHLLLNEISKWRIPFCVSPFKMNEMFMDERALGFCEGIIDRTIAKLRLFTNGSMLDDDKIQRIASWPNDRVEHLWISLNAIDTDRYHEITGLDFKYVSRNLDRLHQMDFPHDVCLSGVKVSDDPDERERFIDYCVERWPKFDACLLERGAWIDKREPSEKTVPDSFCSRWFEMAILSNGKIALCCQDADGEWSIGDFNKTSLLSIYNQPHLLERREEFISRLETDLPCSTCSF